jgi:hypothetical protein
MAATSFRFLAAALLVGGLAASCSFGPPQGCGDNIGGTANEALFDQRFSSMALVSQTTGQPGPNGEEGEQYGQDEALRLEAETKAEVTVRACVQCRSGGGDLPLDKAERMAAGQGSMDLGTFGSGSYVVRVIVEDTLVKNFPFQVK